MISPFSINKPNKYLFGLFIVNIFLGVWFFLSCGQRCYILMFLFLTIVCTLILILYFLIVSITPWKRSKINKEKNGF